GHAGHGARRRSPRGRAAAGRAPGSHRGRHHRARASVERALRGTSGVRSAALDRGPVQNGKGRGHRRARSRKTRRQLGQDRRDSGRARRGRPRGAQRHVAMGSHRPDPVALKGIMSESLIHLLSIGKVFYTDEVETHALSDVHLDIRKGEYVSIEGPSGSGKTTLLSILGLLDTPSSGEYALGDKGVANLTSRERALLRNRHIGFIFQSFNLIGDLTVFENVELPLTYRGMPASERKTRVQSALERVGMSHRAKHMPSQLSGGQQQRVAVARAVAGDPLILLADEPTGNLDSKNGDAVME